MKKLLILITLLTVLSHLSMAQYVSFDSGAGGFDLTKCSINYADDEWEGLAKEYTASNERLLEQLGGFSYTPVKEAVGKLYDWYVQNEDIIDTYKLIY